MRASDFSSSYETDSSLVFDADAAVLRELVNAYFFFPRKCLTTIKTQQEDLERDVCDDGEGALFSSFAYSEDESEELLDAYGNTIAKPKPGQAARDAAMAAAEQRAPPEGGGVAGVIAQMELHLVRVRARARWLGLGG